jgi:hypothetical protein
MEHIRYIIIAILILLAYEDYKYLSVSLWKIILLVLATFRPFYILFFILYFIFRKKIPGKLSEKIASADLIALFCCCSKIHIEEIGLLFTLTGLFGLLFHKISKKKEIPFMLPLLIAFTIITINYHYQIRYD